MQWGIFFFFSFQLCKETEFAAEHNCRFGNNNSFLFNCNINSKRTTITKTNANPVAHSALEIHCFYLKILIRICLYFCYASFLLCKAILFFTAISICAALLKPVQHWVGVLANLQEKRRERKREIFIIVCLVRYIQQK